MKAVFLSQNPLVPGVSTLDVRETKIPDLNEGELLLRVVYCGICGSDFSLAAGTYPGRVEFPLILGHEVSALVEKVGSGCSGRWELGDPVTVSETWGCGKCGVCRSGWVNQCEAVRKIGFNRPGGMAEFLVVPESQVFSLAALSRRIGREESIRWGALVQPYAVALSSLFDASVEAWIPGSTVRTFGAGALGVAATDLAVAAGAGTVEVVERDELRRTTGERWFPDWSWRSEPSSIRAEWTVDTAGVSMCPASLRPGGVWIALARSESRAVSLEHLAQAGVRVHAPDGHRIPDAFPRVLALMENGRLHPDRLIGREIAMDEAVQLMKQPKQEWGRVLVRGGRIRP